MAQRVALWEKRVMEERTSEIFKRLQKKQMEVAREAEEAEQKQEQLWREQGTPTAVLLNMSGLELSTL